MIIVLLLCITPGPRIHAAAGEPTAALLRAQSPLSPPPVPGRTGSTRGPRQASGTQAGPIRRPHLPPHAAIHSPPTAASHSSTTAAAHVRKPLQPISNQSLRLHATRAANQSLRLHATRAARFSCTRFDPTALQRRRPEKSRPQAAILRPHLGRRRPQRASMRGTACSAPEAALPS